MAKAKKNEVPDFSFLQNDGLGGYEQLNGDVMAFPFLKVAQDLSPQLKAVNPEYIEDCRPGMIFNSITNATYDAEAEPIRLVIGKFERYFIEWKPKRGGFAGAHSPLDIQSKLRTGELMLDGMDIVDPKTGNKFADTYVYYVMLPDYMEEGVCLLSLSSTQLKTAKKLNRNLTSTFIPGTKQRALPHFMIWKLSTVLQSNDQGQWYGLRFDFEGFVNPEIFNEVTEARKELPDAQPDLRALESGAEDHDAIDVGAGSKF